MKRLLVILGVGTVSFLAIAMVQEWEVFAESFLGVRRDGGVEVEENDRQAAIDTVRRYLVLMRHLYSTNGDVRFLERLPATTGVTEELMADILYLRRNGRYQEPILQGFNALAVIPLARGRLEVRTKEYWTVHSRFLADGTEADPIRSEVLFTKYRLERDASSWRVTAWEISFPETAGDDDGAAAGEEG
jgi:hypothetical protein